jgi:hypothetical protein
MAASIRPNSYSWSGASVSLASCAGGAWEGGRLPSMTCLGFEFLAWTEFDSFWISPLVPGFSGQQQLPPIFFNSNYED